MSLTFRRSLKQIDSYAVRIAGHFEALQMLTGSPESSLA